MSTGEQRTGPERTGAERTGAERTGAERAGKADGRRDRWREHRAARRLELIAAVVAAVRGHGAGIGVDDIAAASGIAKPVFYRYFTDKADLFLAVGRTLADGVVAEITRAVDAEAEPRRALAVGIDAYVRQVEAEPELYRFVVHHPGLERADATVLHHEAVVGLHVTRLLHDLLRAAGLDAGAAEPWGFGIVGLVRSATDHWLASPTMTRAALVDHLSDLLGPGLARLAPPAPLKIAREL